MFFTLQLFQAYTTCLFRHIHGDEILTPPAFYPNHRHTTDKPYIHELLSTFGTLYEFYRLPAIRIDFGYDIYHRWQIYQVVLILQNKNTNIFSKNIENKSILFIFANK